MTCRCGCGIVIPEGKTWVMGHDLRALLRHIRLQYDTIEGFLDYERDRLMDDQTGVYAEEVEARDETVRLRVSGVFDQDDPAVRRFIEEGK